MDVLDKFRAVIRATIGLPQDAGAPPDILRLGLYRATVTATAADGSTCDVQPEDTRIAGDQGVAVRVGIPGLQAVVQPGAIVLLGWERGDPSRPYCVPSWEAGATLNKLIMNAVAIYLGGQTGAQPAARQGDTVAAGSTPVSGMAVWIAAVSSVLNTAGPVVGAPGTVVPPTDFGKISSGSTVVSIK